MRILHVGIVLFFTFVPAVRADKITLQSGRVIQGEVLQDSPSSITIRLEHGVTTLPRSIVQSVVPTPPMPPPGPVFYTGPVTGIPHTLIKRIPTWQTFTSALAKQKWATNFMQIPATVIDKGQMRAVPYSSYRCGTDYEANVYGDPDAPAGVEIGIYRDLLNDPQAKKNCLLFMTSVMGDQVDAAILRDMKQSKDLVTRGGITIEITAPTDEDAYGGWWISIYDEKALDAARATPQELAQITVPRSSGPSQAITAPPSASNDLTSSGDDQQLYDWRPSDMRYARPSSAGAHGGSVYVRGYYRRDGTYVHSYSRSAPGSGHSSGRGGGHR